MWARAKALQDRSCLLDFGTDLRRIGAEYGSHVDGYLRAVEHDAELAEVSGGPQVPGERLAMSPRQPVDPGLHRPAVRVDIPTADRRVTEPGRDPGQRLEIPIPGGRVSRYHEQEAGVQRV